MPKNITVFARRVCMSAIIILAISAFYFSPPYAKAQELPESRAQQLLGILDMLRGLVEQLRESISRFKSGAAVLNTISDGSLKASWNLDEGSGTAVADASGNNNNGTAINNPLWVDGKSGKALDFDGVDDAVNTGSGASLDDVSSFTYAAWIKPDTRGESNAGRIINKTSDIATVGKRLQFSDTSSNALVLIIDRSTTDALAVSAANVLTMGQWQL